MCFAQNDVVASIRLINKKKVENHLETSLFARNGSLLVFYQESTKYIILTSKRRYLSTIYEFLIFPNVFLSSKILFIIRILI